jgi:hypothetical protein
MLRECISRDVGTFVTLLLRRTGRRISEYIKCGTLILCRLETRRGRRRGFFLIIGAERRAYAAPAYRFLAEVLDQIGRLDEVKREAIVSRTRSPDRIGDGHSGSSFFALARRSK